MEQKNGNLTVVWTSCYVEITITIIPVSKGAPSNFPFLDTHLDQFYRIPVHFSVCIWSMGGNPRIHKVNIQNLRRYCPWSDSNPYKGQLDCPLVGPVVLAID